MIKISNLKVGDTLHDVRSERAGNSICKIDCHWKVIVTAIAEDFSWAELSWNGNPPKRYHTSVPYKRSPKEWMKVDIFGERSCVLCYSKKSDGHKPDCTHPRAVAARKRSEASK